MGLLDNVLPEDPIARSLGLTSVLKSVVIVESQTGPQSESRGSAPVPVPLPVLEDKWGTSQGQARGPGQWNAAANLAEIDVDQAAIVQPLPQQLVHGRQRGGDFR